MDNVDVLANELKHRIDWLMVMCFILGILVGATGFWFYHTRHECITDIQCTEMHNGQPGYGG